MLKSYSLDISPDVGVIGMDIGGTKINVMDDSQDGGIKQYCTADFDSPYDVIDRYIDDMGVEPTKICVGIAAVRNSIDGSVRLVKRDWPVFRPEEATLRYGAEVMTANDMITTAVGIFEQPSDVRLLKKGTEGLSPSAPTLVYAWSTGIGAALVVPRGFSGDRVDHHPTYVASACGHSGFAPQQEKEIDYLRFISSRHLGKLSVEFALGGEDGMRNLIEYQAMQDIPGMHELYTAVKIGEGSGIAAGKTLLDTALGDDSHASGAAQVTLDFLGGMMGYTLRNQILAVDASTVKMTGSVALSLMPYLVENTSFIDRFIDQDARCAYIPEAVGIEMINNEKVAAEGALILASRL